MRSADHYQHGKKNQDSEGGRRGHHRGLHECHILFSLSLTTWKSTGALVSSPRGAQPYARATPRRFGTLFKSPKVSDFPWLINNEINYACCYCSSIAFGSVMRTLATCTTGRKHDTVDKDVHLRLQKSTMLARSHLALPPKELEDVVSTSCCSRGSCLVIISLTHFVFEKIKTTEKTPPKTPPYQGNEEQRKAFHPSDRARHDVFMLDTPLFRKRRVTLFPVLVRKHLQDSRSRGQEEQEHRLEPVLGRPQHKKPHEHMKITPFG